MSKMYIGENFKTPLVRISYAMALHKVDDNGKHSPTLIIPKADLGPVQQAVADAVKGQWDEKGIERFKKGLIKNPIIDGESKSAHNKQGELKSGMGPDVVMIRPWSKNPIKTFGPDVLPMDAKEVQSGWWGYAVLTAFCWHNVEQGDGVSFWINMWQHVKEDEVIGGGGFAANPEDYFSKEKVETSGDGETGAGGAADLFG